jgi:hypothetical protein
MLIMCCVAGSVCCCMRVRESRKLICMHNKKGSSPLSHLCSLYHAKKVQHVEMIYSLSQSTVPKLKFKLKFCACESIWFLFYATIKLRFYRKENSWVHHILDFEFLEFCTCESIWFSIWAYFWANSLVWNMYWNSNWKQLIATNDKVVQESS